MKDILEQIVDPPSQSATHIDPGGINPQKLASFLAKQQEQLDTLKESAINSHLENIKNTLAVTENPDQSITYRGKTYRIGGYDSNCPFCTQTPVGGSPEYLARLEAEHRNHA